MIAGGHMGFIPFPMGINNVQIWLDFQLDY